MRIGLAYDLQPEHASTDHWTEWDRPATVEAIGQALQALGHDVVRIGSAPELLRRLDAARGSIDFLLTLAEGRASRTREAWVPALCELAGLPYVGSPPTAMAASLDKFVAKQIWMASGVPVPRGVSVRHLNELARARQLPFPVIVKPRYEGSGMGIDAGAIIQQEDALAARVAWAIEQYREPVVVEEFIRGGEFTVCLVGEPLRALMPVQRHIDPATTLSCHIVQKSADNEGAAWELPVAPDAALEEQLQCLAVRAAETIGCRDWARVDIRVAQDAQPAVLELNALPSLDERSTFALLADVLGWGFPGLLQRIIAPAIRRTSGRKTPGTSDHRHQTTVRVLTDVCCPMSDVPRR